MVPISTLPLLGPLLLQYISKLWPFLLLHSMSLHGLSHRDYFLLVEGVVHELHIVLRSDLVEDKDADVERTCLHIVSLPVYV